MKTKLRLHSLVTSAMRNPLVLVTESLATHVTRREQTIKYAQARRLFVEYVPQFLEQARS